jgi:CheY-like chemotaxis protein
MRGRILLVDDDPGIVDVVSYSLEREGYEVETATAGNEALAAVSQRRLDLVILDLMLPEVSGEDICRRLRGAGNTVPILMLTAKGCRARQGPRPRARRRRLPDEAVLDRRASEPHPRTLSATRVRPG